MIIENYLDPDVAYFLGLIAIRGTLYEKDSEKRIVIEFPFKSLIAQGINKTFDQKQHIDIAVNHIRERLEELLEGHIQIKRSTSDVTFSVQFLRNSMTWRNIRYLFGDKTSYTQFEIPKSIYDSPDETIKLEFMRGVADAGGFVRKSNYHPNKKRRVYIEVTNSNWLLPIQLCALLQQHLDVPVQNLQWGHPNVRQPNVFKGTAWAKEHQIKIFAESFAKIGFHVAYKQEILEEFIEADQQIDATLYPKCNPNPKIRKIRAKPKHPGENSNILPDPALRGRHFDAYWQICLALGCHQCVQVDDPQQSLLDAEG